MVAPCHEASAGMKRCKLAIERNLLQNVAAIGLKSRAEVVDVNAAQLGHHPVGDAGWNTPHPEIVDADFAPSADDVVAGGNLFQEQRNVGGIVLQVAIHGDDVLAAGMIETCGQAGGLAEVAAQFDDRHAAVHSGDLAQHGEGVVVRAIVHQNHLECLAAGFHHRFQAVVEVGDIFLLVMQRYDDGILGHDLFIIDRKAVLGCRVLSCQLGTSGLLGMQPRGTPTLLLRTPWRAWRWFGL